MEHNIDYIQTVKVQGDSYLVNGYMIVPKAHGNRHYEDLKTWLESNTPEPEFTEEDLRRREREKAINDARHYLQSTDWITSKIAEALAETGDISDILSKYEEELTRRKESRILINELQSA